MTRVQYWADYCILLNTIEKWIQIKMKRVDAHCRVGLLAHRTNGYRLLHSELKLKARDFSLNCIGWLVVKFLFLIFAFFLFHGIKFEKSDSNETGGFQS